MYSMSSEDHTLSGILFQIKIKLSSEWDSDTYDNCTRHCRQYSRRFHRNAVKLSSSLYRDRTCSVKAKMIKTKIKKKFLNIKNIKNQTIFYNGQLEVPD